MIKFYHYNLVTQGPTVVTASTENANFPADNLKDYRATKVWRSTAASANVVFDFVTTESVDTIIILAHPTLGFGFSTPLTIEANATNSWGAPAFSTTITVSDVDEDHQIAFKELTTAQSYRFWRISGSGTGYLELGKVFIGSAHQVGNRSINFGWSYVENDLTTTVSNRYGQQFADIIASQKAIQSEFTLLDKDDLDDLLEVVDFAKTYRPFFVRVGCDDMINNLNRFTSYMRFTQVPQITNTNFGRYATPMTLLEAT